MASTIASPPDHVLCGLLGLTPCLPDVIQLLCNYPSPRLFWSSLPVTFDLVPNHGHSGGVFALLSQGMPNPFPFPSFYYDCYQGLLQFLICDDIWPKDTENLAESFIYRRLHFGKQNVFLSNCVLIFMFSFRQESKQQRVD